MVVEEKKQEHSHSPSTDEELEVLYDSATELFRAIEHLQWQLAFEKCNERSVKTWIKNVGTENTTFQWSVFRRLPIHEACRRQPPAWLVSTLLSIYPESSTKPTKYGELPLHLAVGCGASPEVVNLLVVANWQALLVKDNTGRTPLDMLQEEESLLELEDYKVVHESLTRGNKTLTDIHASWEERLKKQQQEHAATLQEKDKQHQLDIKLQKEAQAKLEQALHVTEAKVECVQLEKYTVEQQVKEKDANETELKARMDQLMQEMEQVTAESMAHFQHVQKLQTAGQQKDVIIAKRERTIQLLSRDLVKITMAHDQKLMLAHDEYEEVLETMLKSQQKLARRLSGQSKSLHALLKSRGIEEPPPLVEKPEEEAAPVEVGPEMDNQEAAKAAAAAALAAIEAAHLRS